MKKRKGLYRRLCYYITGTSALLWFLIRVIPKPSRATYPCQRVAFPIASGFVLYLLGIMTSAFALKKVKKHWKGNRYWIASAFSVIAAVGLLVTLQGYTPFTYGSYQSVLEDPNQPMGAGKGIFPGRVVWVFNRDATNENCIPNQYGHGWFLSENNNQSVIDTMLSDGLQNLTGQTTDLASWQAIFSFYNNNKGKGAVGYSNTEKIFIKINATSSWSGNFNTSDLSVVNNSNYGMSETSPQIVLAVLQQLLNVVGVPQDKIYIGDPMKHIYKHCYDMWHSEFPNVHYLDHSYTTLGRERVIASTTAIIHYSDNGQILSTNVWDNYPGNEPTIQDYLYTIFEETEYMINIPMLKGHKRAGITAFAKNHFGSHTRVDASQLHGGLVSPTGYPNVIRGGYGLYRVQVDFMGHELTGGKNLIYLMDALWCTDDAMSYPKKFFMQPFNNDWSSSIFVSLDPVAIESVGYDFLRFEFTSERDNSDGAQLYVQMDGVDDYLHQAASSSNWPTGIQYDPENDGTVIGSLGTHEHWNNPVDKLYSRNLGSGEGIELITLGQDQPLPIELISFEAHSEVGKITLNWVTKSEINNLGFEVYRSVEEECDYILLSSYKTNPGLTGQGNSSTSFEYSYSDESVESETTYWYKLADLDYSGIISFHEPISVSTPKAFPTDFKLQQNYPNPFNPQTTIAYNLPRSSVVSIQIFNSLGEKVKTLYSGLQTSGSHEIVFDGNFLPSGIYFYQITTKDFSQTNKCLLLK